MVFFKKKGRIPILLKVPAVLRKKKYTWSVVTVTRSVMLMCILYTY